MCYALLTTCRHCTWLLSITYPRCSHAKAYAIDPPSCPHRMKRRYKSSGLCTACKTDPTREGKEEHRKESLSVTPCEVRIQFRDTEVGVVEEGDRVKCPVEGMEGGRNRNEERARRAESVEREKGLRKTRTGKGVLDMGPRSVESMGEDSDGDAYVDSVEEEEESEEDEGVVPLPRKHKSGARFKPLPKPKRQTRKRKRSPSVLEKIQKATPVKKGRRGRSSKAQRMMWPDRIDAGAFAEVKQARRMKNQKLKMVEHTVVKPGKADKQFSMFSMEKKSYESRVAVGQSPSCGQRSSYFPQTGTPMSESRPYHSTADEVDDLAQLIALEASKREKKWR